MERNDARTSNGAAGGAVSDDAANPKTEGGGDDERAMLCQLVAPATAPLAREGGSQGGVDDRVCTNRAPVSNSGGAPPGEAGRNGPPKAPGDDASALMLNWAASVAFAREVRGGEWRGDGDAAVRKKIIAEILLKLYQESNNGLFHPWVDELPRLAKLMEDRLYQSAPSLNAYGDVSTVKRRMVEAMEWLQGQIAEWKRSPRGAAAAPQWQQSRQQQQQQWYQLQQQKPHQQQPQQQQPQQHQLQQQQPQQQHPQQQWQRQQWQQQQRQQQHQLQQPLQPQQQQMVSAQSTANEEFTMPSQLVNVSKMDQRLLVAMQEKIMQYQQMNQWRKPSFHLVHQPNFGAANTNDAIGMQVPLVHQLIDAAKTNAPIDKLLMQQRPSATWREHSVMAAPQQQQQQKQQQQQQPAFPQPLGLPDDQPWYLQQRSRRQQQQEQLQLLRVDGGVDKAIVADPDGVAAPAGLRRGISVSFPLCRSRRAEGLSTTKLGRRTSADGADTRGKRARPGTGELFLCPPEKKINWRIVKGDDLLAEDEDATVSLGGEGWSARPRVAAAASEWAASAHDEKETLLPGELPPKAAENVAVKLPASSNSSRPPVPDVVQSGAMQQGLQRSLQQQLQQPGHPNDANQDVGSDLDHLATAVQMVLCKELRELGVVPRNNLMPSLSDSSANSNKRESSSSWSISSNADTQKVAVANGLVELKGPQAVPLGGGKGVVGDPLPSSPEGRSRDSSAKESSFARVVSASSTEEGGGESLVSSASRLGMKDAASLQDGNARPDSRTEGRKSREGGSIGESVSTEASPSSAEGRLKDPSAVTAIGVSNRAQGGGASLLPFLRRPGEVKRSSTKGGEGRLKDPPAETAIGVSSRVQGGGALPLSLLRRSDEVRESSTKAGASQLSQDDKATLPSRNPELTRGASQSSQYGKVTLSPQIPGSRKRAKFPHILFNMLEHAARSPEVERAVSWSADGRSFLINNREELVKILPWFFKTTQFKSFTRQLNLWGFCPMNPTRGEWWNEHFERKNGFQCCDRLSYVKVKGGCKGDGPRRSKAIRLAYQHRMRDGVRIQKEHIRALDQQDHLQKNGG